MALRIDRASASFKSAQPQQRPSHAGLAGDRVDDAKVDQTVAAENRAASAPRIWDTATASETLERTRNQFLVQVGTAGWSKVHAESRNARSLLL